MSEKYQTNIQGDDRTYFCAGDVVTIRQDIPNKPIMLVIKKETSLFKHDVKKMEDKKSALIGIRCRWFTTSGELQEAIFNTKDLTLINE